MEFAYKLTVGVTLLTTFHAIMVHVLIVVF